MPATRCVSALPARSNSHRRGESSSASTATSRARPAITAAGFATRWPGERNSLRGSWSDERDPIRPATGGAGRFRLHVEPCFAPASGAGSGPLRPAPVFSSPLARPSRLPPPIRAMSSPSRGSPPSARPHRESLNAAASMRTGPTLASSRCTGSGPSPPKAGLVGIIATFQPPGSTRTSLEAGARFRWNGYRRICGAG